MSRTKLKRRRATPSALQRDTPLQRNAWTVEDAKARLSEVLRLASTSGPQRITKRGRPAAVVVSAGQFARMKTEAARPDAWLDHYRARCAGEMSLTRFDDRGREIDW